MPDATTTPYLQSVWNEVLKPDPIWDVPGAAFGSSEEAFKQLGYAVTKLRLGTLSASDADGVYRVAKYIAGSAASLAARVASINLPAVTAEEVQIKSFFAQLSHEAQLMTQEADLLRDRIAVGSSRVMESVIKNSAGLLKLGGALLGLMQIGFAYSTDGADVAGKKAAGVLGGILLAGTGASAGAAVGTLVASIAGVAGVAISATLAASVGALAGAAVVGYAAGKAFEEAYEPYITPGFQWFFGTVDSGSQSAMSAYRSALDFLGKFDGTWLETLDATAEQKAALTTLLAGASQLPASLQMNSDIKKLLEAPFDGGTLVSRDTLIRTVLLISQEQHAYVSERVTVSAGVVAMTLPSGITQATDALRSMAVKLLDPFDQAGFAITGPNRVVVSPSGGTLAGESGNDLMIGSTGVDGLIGNAGNDELIAGAGDDILLGGDGADVLFGGIGNDYLDGGDHSDYLYGGVDNDTYKFAGSFGNDWVVDSDGQGVIQVDGIGNITGADTVKRADGSWESANGNVRYTFVADTGTSGDLYITVSDSSVGSIRIRNWSPGQLGINLADTEAPPEATNSLTGDFRKKTNPEGTQYIIGSDGNYEADGTQVGAKDLITGTANADSIRGLGGDDALLGRAGDDYIDGGSGNDVLQGGTGADTLIGGAGADLIYGSSNGSLYYPNRTDYTPPPANFPVVMGQGLSWLRESPGLDDDGYQQGYLSNNVVRDEQFGDDGNAIEGGAGQDVVYAGTGDDYVSGGDDNDDVYGMGGDDALFGDAGNDRIYGDGPSQYNPIIVYYAAPQDHGADVIDGGAGDDLLLGQGQDDAVYGGVGNDTLYGDDRDISNTPADVHGADYLDGGDGNDELLGGGRDDQLFGGDGDDDLWGDAGAVPSSNRAFLQPAYHGNDYLDGEGGNDYEQGEGGDDTLFGGEGNDTLIGDDNDSRLASNLHGADYLDGEAGDDAVMGYGGDDTLFGGAGDDLLGGDESNDVVAATAHGSDYLDGEEGNDTLIGYGGDDELFGGEGDDLLDGDSTIEEVAGAFHDDDYLDGEAGKDTLIGGGGDDTLFGGDDDDALTGDARIEDVTAEFHGDDYLDGEAGNDTLFGSGGEDTLLGSEGDDLLLGDANSADLAAEEHGNDVLLGGDGNDTLVGGGGADMLDGGAGNDAMRGDDVEIGMAYSGNDTLDGGSGNDSMWGDGGNDVLLGGDGDDWLAGEDEMQVDGTSARSGNDSLSGDAGADVLVGGNGNDLLDGGADNDMLFGGADADTLTGGTGSDSLFGGGGDDVLAGGDGADYLAGEDETSDASISALTGNDSLSGGNGADSLAGGNGDDSLDGGSDDDLLFGGNGNDTLLGGTGNDFLAGDGRVLPGSPSTQMGADLLIGGAGIDTLLGGSGNDTLDSRDDGDGQSIDYLYGGEGDDSIFVGASDGAYGEAGSNTYYVGAGSSDAWITLNQSGNGTDRIVFDASVQASDVEFYKVLITPVVSEDPSYHLFISVGGGQGFWVYDYFQSNAELATSPNAPLQFQFDSGATLSGSDVAAGALNLSILDYDIVYYDTPERGKVHLVEAANSFRLRPGDDDAKLVGNGPAWLYGNGRSNLLTGNDADNDIFGGAGNDTIRGGLGNDTLAGGDGSDMVWSSGGNAQLDGGSGDDTVGAMWESGTGQLYAYGGDGNDVVVGNGDDTLEGGLGDDVLIGASGINTFLFGRGEGNDVAASSGGMHGYGVLQLKAGISPSDVTVRLSDAWNGATLRLNTGETFTMGAFDPLDPVGDNSTVHEIRFADGTVWDLAFLIQETRKGTEGDDCIGGSNGNDTLSGEAGNDYLVGRAGSDMLLGGAGDDVLDGDQASGGTGANGNDTLDGGAGNDTLMGGGGANVYLFGRGDGQDFIPYVHYQDAAGNNGTLQFRAGIAPSDIRLSLAGSDVVVQIVGSNDQVVMNLFTQASGTFQSNVHQIRFADGTTWSRAQILAGLFDGSSGDDTISGSDIGDTMRGLAGNDFLDGQGGRDSILGGDGDDVLIGGSGIDTLEGGAGDDELDPYGAGGADRLVGGAGDDTYYIDSTSDVAVEATNEGLDWVISSVNWTLGANFENLTLTNGGVATGNALANRIETGSTSDTLTGGAGNDTLNGGGYSDVYVFNRGDGQDVILNDDICYTDTPDYESEVATADTLRFGPNIATTDVLASRAGDDLVLRIRGTADQVTVQGHFSAPVTVDQGWALFQTDKAIDLISFNGGASWNASAIQAAVAMGASNHAPTVANVLPSLAARQGSTFSYVVPANTFADSDANDWLVYQVKQADGSPLPAWLSFDASTRTLSGNPPAPGTLSLQVWATDGYGASVAASAQLVVSANRAPVVAAPIADQNAAQGAAFSYTVPSGAFSDDIGDTLSYSATLADGTALPSWLTFNPANRVFTGTPPSTGTVSISVIATDAGGLSVADVFNVSITAQNLTLTGTSGADTLTGAAGNDQLSGLGGNDRLVSQEGNDTLDGGTGTDTLVGSVGNDIYIVDNTSDVVTELPNEGLDLVQSSATTYTLSANVENLTLTGTSTISGTGNALDNLLTGNSGNNTLTGLDGNDTLDGGSGNDTMVGGLGNDTYVVNTTSDVITETVNQGIDTVMAGLTWTLNTTALANVENVTLTGTGTFSATGNALANLLVGNSANNTLTGLDGNDTLDGGLGNDTMVGGLGDDTYVVNTTSDTITENAGQGTDTVLANLTWTIASLANLENITLTGSGNIGATGNGNANVLIGNAGANTLTGAAGTDTLDGGTGNDTLDGGAAADTYLFGRGYGVDTVTDTDSTANVKDRIQLGAGIVQGDMRYSRVGNNLEALINGTSDKIVVQNWYVGSQYHVEEFRFSDGSILTDSQVQGLVGAMASFGSTSAATTGTSGRVTRGTLPIDIAPNALV
ncbi:calcium-binding protein [Sphaerotilaceae bacterium SBD11-9]